jgi:hypothetical protein
MQQSHTRIQPRAEAGAEVKGEAIVEAGARTETLIDAENVVQVKVLENDIKIVMEQNFASMVRIVKEMKIEIVKE